MPLKTFAIVTFILSLTFFVSGQKENGFSALTELDETTKIDEFESISDETVPQKMQKFAEYLQKNKTSKGYIIHFGDYTEPVFRQTIYYKRKKSREYSNYFFQWLKSLKVTLIMGGLRQQKKFEIWVVPPNGKVPEEKEEAELQRELLYRFDLLETGDIRFQNLPDSTGKSSPAFEISNKIDMEDLLSVAAEVLAADDSKRTVLIYYLDDSSGNVEALRKVFEDFVIAHARKNGLDLNRVKLVYGGFRNKGSVESWVIPINEIEPEPMPEEKLETIEESRCLIY